MEGLMSMIQNSSKTNEIHSLSEIDNSNMQEFLSKLAIWDFFDMAKGEFTSKSEVDREKLIINYYSSLMSGIICYLFYFSGSGSGFFLFKFHDVFENFFGLGPILSLNMHVGCTFVELATIFLILIAKSQEVANLNKRASLMLLSKEANSKDVQLKSQLMMSFQDEDATKGASEFIWPKHGYFGEHNIDLSIPKANFPELTVCYVNQARVSVFNQEKKQFIVTML